MKDSSLREMKMYSLDIHRRENWCYSVNVLDDDLCVHSLWFVPGEQGYVFSKEKTQTATKKEYNTDNIRQLIAKAEDRLIEFNLKVFRYSDKKNIHFHPEWSELAEQRDNLVEILLNKGKHLPKPVVQVMQRQLKVVESKLKKLEDSLFEQGWFEYFK